jgi:predicted phosphodiesterase
VIGDESTDRTILLWPDTHAPYHDRRAVHVALEVVCDVQPDEVLLLGDFIDTKAPARWSKGRAGEFAADLPQELEAGKQILAELRSVHPRDLTWIEGNHELRIRSYLHAYAPALLGVVPSFAELMEFDRFNVQYREQPYKVGPGVLAIHGNKMSSTQNAAGQSAYKERMRFGASIVQGHTHRAGLGYDTQERTRFWMECGHLLDIKKADYLDFKGTANWQQALGLIRVVGNKAFASLHYIDKGTTVVEGRVYRA